VMRRRTAVADRREVQIERATDRWLVTAVGGGELV
jgi:hypothetical protein